MEYFFPELLLPNVDFLYDFVTPIIKAEKGKIVKYFYNINNYNKWKNNVSSGYFITYYKGLGSIEPFEAKMFFKNLDKHLIKFNYDNPEKTKDVIDLVFNTDRADDRKKWLLNYDRENILDQKDKQVPIEDFINKDELVEVTPVNIRLRKKLFRFFQQNLVWCQNLKTIQ